LGLLGKGLPHLGLLGKGLPLFLFAKKIKKLKK
jgi:hypothetical protein